MGRDHLWLVAVTLAVGVGCGTKAPPGQQGNSRRSLTAKVKAVVTVTTTATETATSTHTETDTETATTSGTATASTVVTVTQTTTGTQTSAYAQSTTSTQTRTAAGNTTTKTATAFNLPVSSTAVGTMTAINDWVASRTYLWTATLTRVATLPTTFNGTGTATGTYADSGVTYSSSGTTTSTMQFTGFAASTKTQTVAAYYAGAVSRTANATGTGTGWNGRLTWTYTKTATGSHTEVYTQTAVQTLTQTTFPTATHTATATASGTITQSGTVTNTITETITETVTRTVTSTATSTSVDGGTGTDSGLGACLQDWRDTACGQTCLAETQWDRMHCAVFLDCYLQNGCGPSTCGSQDDVCGVNKFSYGTAPKLIADQVYECLRCPQDPLPCAAIDVVASRTYGPCAAIDGAQSFTSPVALRVPSILPVTHGSAGNGTATLSLATWGACPTCWLNCTYRGLAGSAHPTTPDQLMLGRTYGFVSCDSNLGPNNQVLVKEIRLHIDQGDALAGTTSIQLITPCATNNPVPVTPLQPGLIREIGTIGSYTTPETPMPTPPGQPYIPDPYLPPTSCRAVDGCVPIDDPNLPVFEVPTGP